MKKQQGSSLLIVLVLLTALLLGSLSLARVTDTSTLVSGNLSYKASALQASEVGISEAFAALQTMTASEEANHSGWYFATVSPVDAAGLPTGINWDAARKVQVGAFEASYIVERLCNTAPATDPDNECFQERVTASGSAKAGQEQMEAAAVKQYRMTVSVKGPKGTRTFVQSVATR